MIIFFAFIITTSSIIAQDVIPKGKYKFDLKTKFGKEKVELEGIKRGLASCMEQSGWAKKVEIKENYTVWIRNVSRTYSQDSVMVTINFDFELRKPSLFKLGDVIKSKFTNNEYNSTTDWVKQTQSSMINHIKSDIDKHFQMKLILGTATKSASVAVSTYFTGYLATPVTEMMLNSLMSYLGIKKLSDKEKLIQQSESTYISYLLYLQLTEWILEIESGK